MSGMVRRCGYGSLGADGNVGANLGLSALVVCTTKRAGGLQARAGEPERLFASSVSPDAYLESLPVDLPERGLWSWHIRAKTDHSVRTTGFKPAIQE